MRFRIIYYDDHRWSEDIEAENKEAAEQHALLEECNYYEIEEL